MALKLFLTQFLVVYSKSVGFSCSWNLKKVTGGCSFWDSIITWWYPYFSSVINYMFYDLYYGCWIYFFSYFTWLASWHSSKNKIIFYSECTLGLWPKVQHDMLAIGTTLYQKRNDKTISIVRLDNRQTDYIKWRSIEYKFSPVSQTRSQNTGTQNL